jgi:hypothetical protein
MHKAMAMRYGAGLGIVLSAVALVGLVAGGERSVKSPSASTGKRAVASTQPQAPSEAAYQRHVAKRREASPDAFTVRRAGPFVVIGNGEPKAVRAHAEQTVAWAVEKLKAAYFKKNPDHIIDIYLFKDAESYRRFCQRRFGRAPTTPFGFYLRSERAMVMNIATGGGTLVHELVHPFMAANFPKCPPWFNEGLGSLYEQSAERDGRIVGRLNWRLPVLQRAIENDKLPSLARLLAMDDQAFYGEGSGRRYAQARYLCYYLQQQGKLRDFYRRFEANQQDDPTGARTFKAVLDTDDLAVWDRRWRRWALELKRRTAGR